MPYANNELAARPVYQPPTRHILRASLHFYLVTPLVQKAMVRLANAYPDAVEIWDAPNGDCILDLRMTTKPKADFKLHNFLADLDLLAQQAKSQASLALGVETPVGWQEKTLPIGPGHEPLSPWLAHWMRLQ